MLAVQCKMARVALGLGVRELAAAAQVSPDTIARLERGEELKSRTAEAIKGALESAGVIFVEENGEGPGVRLRKQKAGKLDDSQPTAPATKVVKAMDAAIARDRIPNTKR